MRKWADVPSDVLFQIIHRINSFEDFITFGSVCRGWQLATIIERRSPQVPWLMLHSVKQEQPRNFCQFFSLPKGKSHKLILPETNGKQCLASKGWILIVKHRTELCLFHPLSCSKISLPRIVNDRTRISIDKAVLSSSKLKWTSNFMVMVIYESCKRLALYKHQDKIWTGIETEEEHSNIRWLDIIYHNQNGKFYMVGSSKKIFVLKLFNKTEYKAVLVSQLAAQLPGGSNIRYLIRLYLVELSGELLIVKVKIGDSSRPTYNDLQSYQFQIHQVDLKQNGRCILIKNIGNKALFLGINSSSFCVEASTETGCKPNCIYFLDFCDGVYNMTYGTMKPFFKQSSGTIKPLFKHPSDSATSVKLWLEPSF